MRWSYKTVHFELKKEGLLGSAFLDESEVEHSLNEYGKAGWELVSVLETIDGLIAIFKQPLNPHVNDFYPLEEPEVKVESLQQVQDEEEVFQEIPAKTSERTIFLNDFEVVEDEVGESSEKSRPPLDIGTIRIE